MKKLLLLLSICFLNSVSGYEYDPIAVYLTWQKSPETTMTIQWITDQERKSSSVQYHLENETEWKSQAGDFEPMPYSSNYYIHSVELTNLNPDTTYVFKTGKDAKAYKFHTMPADNAEPIRFVVGGDMYQGETTEFMEITCRQAASKDPMFALIGGDLAYTVSSKIRNNAERERRWIDFLIAWKKTMFTPNGIMIPIIPALGNEDTLGKFGQTPAQSPYFYAFFPLTKKLGFNVLDFGKQISIVVLDSGHTHPIYGEQKEWLHKTLKMRESIPHKFALYHVPAWPSYRKMKNEMSPLIRLHWVPLFEKFGLTTAFEHHDHAYKRTPLIYQGEENQEKGVLYLGDGGWGAKKLREPKKANSRWYLEFTAQERHFILVTIDKEKRSYQAITMQGKEFDSFTH